MNLKDLRKKFNFTQKQVADFLQTTQQTYNNYENSKSEPSIDMLIKLSKLYNLSVDYIVGNNSLGLSLKQQELISKIHNCNDNVCDKLLSYLEGIQSRD